MTPDERQLLLSCAGRILTILTRLEAQATSGHSAMLLHREADMLAFLLDRIVVDAHGNRVTTEGS